MCFSFGVPIASRIRSPRDRLHLVSLIRNRSPTANCRPAVMTRVTGGTLANEIETSQSRSRPETGH